MAFRHNLTTLILGNRFARRFRNYLDNDDIDIHQRVLTMSIVICVTGGILSLIISFLVETNPTANFLSDIIGLPVGFTNMIIAGVLLLGVFTIILSIWKRNIQIPAIIFIILTIVLFLPLMFFNDGGICGGVPPWFVLAISLSPLLLIGGKRFVMYALGILSFAFCIIVSFLHPELVLQNETQLETYVDILQCVVIVALIISCIYRFKTYAFDRQHKRLEEREKDLEAAIEEIRDANAAKSAFLANMSHEIRTPINAVLGMNELILRESKTPEITGYAEIIHRSGTSLLSLINDILDISKVESGRIEIHPGTYSISDVIADCYSMVSSLAQEKDLQLKLDADKTMPDHLIGDIVRIRQIIANLMTNAVKYTNEGTIEMTVGYIMTGPDTADITISVKDTGIGIRKEDMPILFEKFRRIEESRNASIQGSGLGLAITKKLLDLMDGTISVESIYGVGSVFTVTIPQKIADTEGIGDRLSTTGVKTIQNHNSNEKTYRPSFVRPDVTILAVDDVAVNLEVIKGFLKKTQIQIETANSGRAALALIRDKQYDLILMDDRMPGLTGVETLAKIREENLLPKTVPVIMLTANALVGAKTQYLSAGFTDFLSKPVRGIELENLIRKYLPKDTAEKSSTENITGTGTECITENSTENSTESLNIPPADTGECKNTGSFVTLDGIDEETAKTYTGSDPELYRICLEAYLSDSRTDRLEKHFQDKNTEEYRTEIHGLKSASKSIGAATLSEKALALENAAKSGDWEYISENHARTMQEYKTLLDNIQKYLNGEKP